MKIIVRRKSVKKEFWRMNVAMAECLCLNEIVGVVFLKKVKGNTIF